MTMEIGSFDILVNGNALTLAKSMSPKKPRDPVRIREISDLFFNIIKSINDKKDYLEYKGTLYPLPQEIPDKLFVTLPFSLEGEERDCFFRQYASGNFDIRGVKFHYKKELSEQQVLEQRIEKYLLEGSEITKFEVTDLANGGLGSLVSRAEVQSQGNAIKTLGNSAQAIFEGKGTKHVRGRERLNTLIRLAPGWGIKKTVNDPEIKPNYDRLMEIYAEAQK